MRKQANRPPKKGRLLRWVMVILLVLLMGACGTEVYLLRSSQSAPQEPVVEEVPRPSFSQCGQIAELAALKSYFHDFENYEEGKNSFFQIGHKKIWIEYGGVIKTGINAKKLKIAGPNEEGVVTVTLPKAEVLSVVVDTDSLQETENSTVFVSFSTKEKTELFAKAQSHLRSVAENNEDLLNQSMERVKVVLKNYITNVGNALGQTYTVQWIETK